MKNMLIIFLSMFLLSELPAQINKYGVPFIKNYPTQLTGGSEQNWCIAQDKFGNIYFGNQNRGIIRYDGTRWNTIQIKNNPRVYSLASDDRGIIFIGAAFEFGYLQPDKKGKTEYISLSDRIDSVPEIKVIFSIVTDKQRVFFLSPQFIYQYDIKSDSLSRIDLVKQNIKDANRLVKINDKLILADNVGGIFELKDTIVKPLPGGDFFKRIFCTVLLPFDENSILVTTFYNGVFLYNYRTGKVRSDFIDPGLNEKLKEINIYAAAKITGDLYAIGTTKQEGVLFFNSSGELVHHIKKENSDLEDNTILSLFCDYKSGSELWIAATGYLSKTYINLPLTMFSAKQGIESGVNAICEFDGKIYLTTDAGVLRSEIVNNYTSFRKIPGSNLQVFPITVINSENCDFLLAGSINGIISISRNDEITRILDNCLGKPKKDPASYLARTIVQSSLDPKNVYFGLEPGGLLILRYENGRWRYINRYTRFTGSVYGIVEKKEGGLWLITDDPSSLFSISISGSDTTITRYGPEKGIDEVKLVSMCVIEDELYITTSSGILKYDNQSDIFIGDTDLTIGYSQNKFSQNLFTDTDGDLWYSGMDKTHFDMVFQKNSAGKIPYRGVLNLLPNVPTLDILSSDGKIYLTKSKIVPVLDKSELTPDSTIVKTLFVSIVAGGDSVVMDGQFYSDIDSYRRVPEFINPSVSVPEYGFDMNRIAFKWTTPYFTEELQTEYSFKLEGYDKDWSDWQGISFGYNSEAIYSGKQYENLPYGHYIFKVRTRTLTGLPGNELNYEFLILKPWYATVMAVIGFILLALLIVYGLILTYTKRLKNENLRLEGIVAERTAVVVKQKDELESSIHYASRIQMALLPSNNILSENLKNHFILFKPRDIVSGDFYWMTKKEERLILLQLTAPDMGCPEPL